MTSEDLDKGFAAVDVAMHDASRFGHQESQDGAQMYGQVPHVAPQAWFHIVYPPLDESQLVETEQAIGRPIPGTYRTLLQRANGLYLFSGAPSFYGHRTDYLRSPAVSFRLPESPICRPPVGPRRIAWAA